MWKGPPPINVDSRLFRYSLERLTGTPLVASSSLFSFHHPFLHESFLDLLLSLFGFRAHLVRTVVESFSHLDNIAATLLSLTFAVSIFFFCYSFDGSGLRWSARFVSAANGNARFLTFFFIFFVTFFAGIQDAEGFGHQGRFFSCS